MACLLVVALAENNLEERMLWAGSDTGTRVERETYKKYIVWALKAFDINEEEYTENNKANKDEKRNDGSTPLHDAAYHGQREVVEVLLQNKANVDEKPYHGHREVVEVLLQNRTNVDEQRNDGNTPLHLAAYHGHRELVEMLLQNKAKGDNRWPVSYEIIVNSTRKL
ncbi:alpha-latrocrustotoxin-Lt1a-like [Haliotis rufescens]|uniref:alpha-latrocrustotoxin-Lt1a-like n=1 Tax=Haliotis rufescens TaxID=6454 RepID=UPI00201FA844|nr:alpha-latrocrustotoxin-Lt1a-like [Haliotis rufescens]